VMVIKERLYKPASFFSIVIQMRRTVDFYQIVNILGTCVRYPSGHVSVFVMKKP